MKTEIPPIPARGRDLSSQLAAVRAEMTAAAQEVAAAEARQVASAADDTAYAQAKSDVVAATERLNAHRTRRESLEKLQALEDATECAALRDWLHERAIRIEAESNVMRADVLAARLDEIDRHNAALALLDWKAASAQTAAGEAGRQANAANGIDDAAAMRAAVADAEKLDALNADPVMLTLFTKKGEGRGPHRRAGCAADAGRRR